MTEHPLTDEICYQLAELWCPDPGERENMRAAADWQLEQVIKWLDGRYMGEDVLSVDIVKGLMETMRPTTQEEDS